MIIKTDKFKLYEVIQSGQFTPEYINGYISALYDLNLLSGQDLQEIRDYLRVNGC